MNTLDLLSISARIAWLELKLWALQAFAAIWNPYWRRVCVPVWVFVIRQVLWRSPKWRVYYTLKLRDENIRLLRQAADEIRRDRIKNPHRYRGVRPVLKLEHKNESE